MNGTTEPAVRSLLVRTTLVLAAALVVAVAALLLFFQPLLGDAIRRESTATLAQQQNRARSAALDRADAVELLLRESVKHAWDTARGEVADAPVELMEGRPDDLRAHFREEFDARERDSDRKLTVLLNEMRERSERRLREATAELQSRDHEHADAFARDLAFRAGALVLALLALVFLVHGVLLYRTVLAPVRRLSEATREVARGSLATRIPVEGDDEVARLGASFNAMTESLEKALGDLQSLNATLEDRIREKTAALTAALDESREANRRLESAMRELRAKERELRQAEKMASLGTLAGGIAHEFNNLLGGILGCAEDAAQDEGAAEMRETLHVIERTARRGTAITHNLLRFARPAGGSREPVGLGALARDVAALIEPEAVRTGVRVSVEAEAATEVVADPSGLHQVLLNLATNALHAMRERGGDLTIRVVPGDGGVRIDVEDTGVGIDPQDRDRLFEPFFTTRGSDGTGLGLSVSYGIVTSHGGRLEVSSEPGRGSCFSVFLPAPETAEGECET